MTRQDSHSSLRSGLIAAAIGGTVATSAALGDCQGQWDVSIGQPGMNQHGIHALAVFDDGSGEALYAGGHFAYASGELVWNIARWNGEQWEPVGGGMNNAVYALTVFDDGSGPALYAAGAFTQAGGQPARRIAKWDGQQWSSLANGIGVLTSSSWVYALGVHDDGSGPALYAGGEFSTASGVSVNNVARWDGQQWSAVGGGLNNWVSTFAEFDDGSGTALYAGGAFGGTGWPGNGLAKWNGQQWVTTPAGSISGGVNALLVVDTGSSRALYAAGSFSQVALVPANNIARWDGNWSPLGAGLNGGVGDLVQFDDGTGAAIYAAGSFTMAGDVEAHGIAKWDGQQWSALGDGVMGANPWVRALVSIDDPSNGPTLFVGGGFFEAGGQTANRIAAWRPNCPEPNTGDLNGDGYVDVSDLLILLAAWGECPRGVSCPADLNNDGTVDVSDLLILLSNWG